VRGESIFALSSFPDLPPRRIFLAAAPRGGRRVVYFLILLSAPLGVAGYATDLTVYAYTHYGPVAAWYRSRPFWLAAAVLGVLALWLCLRAGWRSRTVLTVTAGGLTLVRPPATPLSLAWEEVRGVEVRLRQTWPGKQVGGRVTLHLSDGGRVRLRGFSPDMLLLAQHLQRSWYTAHLAHFRRLWREGEVLDFGALHLSKQGMKIGKKFYLWREVQRVALRGGRLMIELENRQMIAVAVFRVYSPEALLWWLQEEIRR